VEASRRRCSLAESFSIDRRRIRKGEQTLERQLVNMVVGPLAFPSPFFALAMISNLSRRSSRYALARIPTPNPFQASWLIQPCQ
jgi:hypothetical protein